MNSEDYLQNFTLKSLLKCTTELGQLYEVFLKWIMRKLEVDQSITFDGLKDDFTLFKRKKLEIAAQCSLIFPSYFTIGL